MTSAELTALGNIYRTGLVGDTLPFWLKHGLDRQHGGLLTGLARDGTVVETDKAIWLQGRAAWTFATAYHTVEPRTDWLAASAHCLDFLRRHGRGAEGKLYFTVTQEGRPLRMRRYAFSESFAAIGAAAYSRAAGDPAAAAEAADYFAGYLHYNFDPGAMPPKTDPATRPSIGVAPHMIAIATAQEMRAALGDITVAGRTLSGWIDVSLQEIATKFYHPELGALLEQCSPDGSVLDHFDGRTLNPGHALECAWFVLHEAKHRGGDARLLQLGRGILDDMWERGWDREHGGIFYFRDLKELPLQEYWAEMKFWWPHNEAVIATLLAYQLTGDEKYARWHRLVHDWAHRVFADPLHGEWFGYAHRDGKISTQLKGNLWKGPFHLPRMQWYCWRLTQEMLSAQTS